MGKVTRDNLDDSPSVDLSRSDPDRIDLYVNKSYAGGTSTKNVIHMSQQYGVKRLQKYDYGNWNFYTYG